jgi:acyl-CoA synthetase (AMP-forming)/AMP-acid ligase II
MHPRHIEVWPGALPRTANGKFDRVLIRQQLLTRLATTATDHAGDGND